MSSDSSKFDFKKIWFLLCIIICSITPGCKNPINTNSFNISVFDYMLVYNGDVPLEQVTLRSDEIDEITALYQEIGDDVGYKDSLLIAEKYSQGMGINAFVQSNLDTLYDYNLTLSNVKKTQIIIKYKNQNRKAVLLEYEITDGFIESIPLLYMSQLFIENDGSIILASYSTENSQDRDYASNMFKNIK